MRIHYPASYKWAGSVSAFNKGSNLKYQFNELAYSFCTSDSSAHNLQTRLFNRRFYKSFRESQLGRACSDVCVSNALHVESRRSGCGSLAV